jgi:hypothetical protein
LIGRNINGTEHERNDGMTEVTEITEQRNGCVWENGLGEIIHNSIPPLGPNPEALRKRKFPCRNGIKNWTDLPFNGSKILLSNHHHLPTLTYILPHDYCRREKQQLEAVRAARVCEEEARRREEERRQEEEERLLLELEEAECREEEERRRAEEEAERAAEETRRRGGTTCRGSTEGCGGETEDGGSTEHGDGDDQGRRYMGATGRGSSSRKLTDCGEGGALLPLQAEKRGVRPTVSLYYIFFFGFF